MALPLLSIDVFDFPAVNKQPSKSALVAFQVSDKLIFSILAPSPVGQNRIWEYVEVLKYQNKKKILSSYLHTIKNYSEYVIYILWGSVYCSMSWKMMLHSSFHTFTNHTLEHIFIYHFKTEMAIEFMVDLNMNDIWNCFGIGIILFLAFTFVFWILTSHFQYTSL